MEPLTQAAFARRHGVSRQYVHQLVRKGRIPVGADGRIDPAAGDAAMSTINLKIDGRGGRVLAGGEPSPRRRGRPKLREVFVIPIHEWQERAKERHRAGETSDAQLKEFLDDLDSLIDDALECGAYCPSCHVITAITAEDDDEIMPVPHSLMGQKELELRRGKGK